MFGELALTIILNIIPLVGVFALVLFGLYRIIRDIMNP